MPGLVLTNKALEDLREIGRYTERRWGREQRNHYLAILDRGVHDLAAAPLSGRDCSALRPNYRKWPVGKHIVFYRTIEPDQIEIVRVLHERMDVELHFDDA